MRPIAYFIWLIAVWPLAALRSLRARRRLHRRRGHGPLTLERIA
jgi:hypothetical protein